MQPKVDALVSGNLVTSRAAKQATKTIPIIMVTTGSNPTGIVDSLARPGANITGLTTPSRDLSGKTVGLLKEAIPATSRGGVLWDANAPGPFIALKEYEAVACALKIQLQSLLSSIANFKWQPRRVLTPSSLFIVP